MNGNGTGTENTDILVVGAGGVGGLLAGPLIRRYRDGVALAARGARETLLREKGLTLRSEVYGDFTVYPGTVTNAPSTLPVQKLILVCVKNQDLEEAARQIVPVTDEDTCVIPVMNGVTAGEVLRRSLKKGTVCDSVIYTISGVAEDGSVHQKGGTRLILGAPQDDERAVQAAMWAEKLLREAGISCRYRKDARAEIWKKFVLNCAYNVVTARHGIPTGVIAASDKLTKDYRSLMEEAWLVGRAEGVELDEDVVDRHMELLPRYDPKSESSLSRDFARHQKGEMDIFGGVVAAKARKRDIPVPVTEEYYHAMQEMVRTW